MSENEDIERLFNTLKNWRGLPSYKLENRVDFLIGIYLPQVISKLTDPRIDEELIVVIPEFPLRYGTLIPEWFSGQETKFDKPEKGNKGENHSIKVDFAVFNNKTKQAHFIELKTDKGSMRVEQMVLLERAKCIGIQKLSNGVSQLNEKSKKKPKYKNLLKLIPSLDNEWKTSILYICPEETKFPKDVEMDEKMTLTEFAKFIKEGSCGLKKSLAKFLEDIDNQPV